MRLGPTRARCPFPSCLALLPGSQGECQQYREQRRSRQRLQRKSAAENTWRWRSHSTRQGTPALVAGCQVRRQRQLQVASALLSGAPTLELHSSSDRARPDDVFRTSRPAAHERPSPAAPIRAVSAPGVTPHTPRRQHQ